MEYPIEVIAWDADDTLWVNEPYFQEAQREFGALIAPWVEADEVLSEHYRTEQHNLPLYGYGIKGFTLSLIETALRVSDQKIGAREIGQILAIGKNMHNYPITLIDGVQETLRQLQTRYRMVVATKGDLLDQERKLERSGLAPFFHHIEVMSEKNPASYLKLLRHLDLPAERFLMIGNSLKSDIVPVLAIGGRAIHVPAAINWIHEEVEHFDTRHPRFLRCKEIRDVLQHL